MPSNIGWGIFLPHGWKQELRGMGSRSAWDVIQQMAILAERLGYNHLWVFDHMHTVPRPAPVPLFDSWTVLTGIAQLVRTVRLGHLVNCVAYRNPALMAKQAACLDVVSGGRLIYGLGAGWDQAESEAYGCGFPSARDRLALLEDSVQIARLLWTYESTTFSGKRLQLRDAFCEPKPLQDLPPVWIGGGGEKKTLKITAKYADAANWQVGIDLFRRKSRVLATYCEQIGREFGDILRTHAPNCILFDSTADYRRWLQRPEHGRLSSEIEREDIARGNFVGTVDRVIELALEYVSSGCSEFILFFRDYPRTDSLERMVSEVIPHVAPLRLDSDSPSSTRSSRAFR